MLSTSKITPAMTITRITILAERLIQSPPLGSDATACHSGTVQILAQIFFLCTEIFQIDIMALKNYNYRKRKHPVE